MKDSLSLNLVFLGAPGSGKGTQTKRLVSKYGFILLSTGDVLRSQIQNKSTLGMRAAEYINRGELVPDNIIIDIIKSQLSHAGGFIFDGFPRTLVQARALSHLVNIDKVVFLDVPKADIVERLVGRRICKNCGFEYHIKFVPSALGEKCEKCTGMLFQRKDDTEEVIDKRLRVFDQETRPLIDFYKNLIIKVDGSGTVNEIFLNIESVLDMRR